ncbi:MAG: type II toxin-antitoxin system PemK/MazF family toxin [Candidatus Diapherotrites archaeon]|jgi:mRNA interferase MazF|nr:type II toxin-antitoxin system PemK/MazF family toxin [Candidatus Diapherotrites archaeon]MBT4596509.1 type II toxin-antitoxin system PemK/MazF family toxin [Candidatus Diapherotrites archaeon]
MEGLVKGNIVVMPFPFTDLKATKKRPALVIANLLGDDLIVCQITGQIKKDTYVVELKDSQINGGKLSWDSFIRTNKIFTADKSIILYKIGSLKKEKMYEVENKIINIVKE